ncbi:hypothetical protein MANES_09G060002v8 [Manihot esculenta]|uniref:Uncharacterized protein n=1 Tax=Manihot esculenta TaxID=3983 RepID=A0ACB7H4Y0_MANES|nr:hypothetical protein MANES_09G060002v8 [Manihot esculenta]
MEKLLPLLWYCNTHISIELPDKTGEIVVLEIPRQYDSSKLHRVPNHEALPCVSPRDNLVQRLIIHEIMSFREKWRYWILL